MSYKSTKLFDSTIIEEKIRAKFNLDLNYLVLIYVFYHHPDVMISNKPIYVDAYWPLLARVELLLVI